MKRFTAALAMSAASMVVAGTASADGVYAPSVKDAVPAAACCKWGGLYVAGSIGYSVVDTDWRRDTDVKHDESKYEYEGEHGYYEKDPYASLSDSFSNSDDGHDDGFTGTIAIGYDREVHSGWIIGAFADYTFGNFDDDHRVTDAKVKNPYDYGKKKEFDEVTDAGEWEFDDTWAVGARIGVARCCTLWYLTAGYTETEVEFKSADWRDDEDLHGYFLGAGVEHMLRPGFSLKFEYRYSDYGDADFSRSNSKTSLGAPCGDCGHEYDYEVIDKRDQRAEIDTEIHSIRLGVAYKFDLHRPAAAPAPLK